MTIKFILPSHFFVCNHVCGSLTNIDTIDCFINCVKSELETSVLLLNNGVLQIVKVWNNSSMATRQISEWNKKSLATNGFAFIDVFVCTVLFSKVTSQYMLYF